MLGNKYILAIDIISLGLGINGMVAVANLPLPPHLQAAGPWQFLTNLSLMLSNIVFALGVIAHATKSSTIFQWKNRLGPFGLIMEMIVFMVYWPLRLFFLHLLVKNIDDFRATLFIDLSIHLMPVVLLLVDFMWFLPTCTITNSQALAICLVATGGYWLWLHRIVDLENGAEFPYNFLNVDSTVVRGVIFTFVGLVAFLNFVLIQMVYRSVVSERKHQ